MEWEARVTHKIHHNNWKRTGSLAGLKRNPLIVPNPYIGASKCNIFVGEMAFRAGFRVFVYITGNGLVYFTGNSLVRPCASASDDGERILSPSSSATISYIAKTYRIGNNIPRGKKRFVTRSNIGQINNGIQGMGKVIIYARKRYCESGTVPYPTRGTPCSDSTDPKSFHVVFISNIRSVSGTSVVADVLDQHLMDSRAPGYPDIPRNCGVPGYCGCRETSARAFIELIPGGDPTEEWGVIDLNCLTEVVP